MKTVPQLVSEAARCLELIEVQRERPKLPPPVWPWMLAAVLVLAPLLLYGTGWFFAGWDMRCRMYGVCERQ